MNSILSHVSARLFLAETSTVATSRYVAATAALLFGALLIFGVGFASPELIHNAAHDGRHAFVLPCH